MREILAINITPHSVFFYTDPLQFIRTFLNFSNSTVLDICGESRGKIPLEAVETEFITDGAHLQ